MMDFFLGSSSQEERTLTTEGTEPTEVGGHLWFLRALCSEIFLSFSEQEGMQEVSRATTIFSAADWRS